MIQNLEKLCSISGISGREKAVSEEIERQIKGHCEYYYDNLGNLIAVKKGKNQANHKVMISAHMDEVGMIITSVTSDGMLRFAPVGGIDSRVLIGRSVLVGEKMYGVIGTKAVHLQSPEERKTAVKSDDLFIDIGAIDKEDALKHISLGESVCFDSPFVSFGNGFLKGKAIDDRFGCALMIRMIQGDLEYDTTFVFCVQEEVGLRGAKAAAYTVNPDFAIVCEATTAADVSDVPDNKKVCKLGNGAVVSYMDHRTVYDKELYDLAFSTAQEHQIACQTKTMVAGGNDAGAIHTSRGGVRTMAISIPCRYLHSPSCVIQQQDMESCYQLVRLMAERIQKL